MDILPFIEAIGFDYSVVGAIVLAAAFTAWGLVAHVRDSPLEAARRGFERCRDSMQPASALGIVPVVLAVALAGTAANSIADAVFDDAFRLFGAKAADGAVEGDQDRLGPCVESPAPTPALWPDGPDERFFLFPRHEEDLVKQQALRDICEQSSPRSAAVVHLTQHAGEDGAKQLAQTAAATMLTHETGAGANAQLRLEYVAVKVMRTLGIGFALLLVAGLVRCVRNAVAAGIAAARHAIAWIGSLYAVARPRAPVAAQAGAAGTDASPGATGRADDPMPTGLEPCAPGARTDRENVYAQLLGVRPDTSAVAALVVRWSRFAAVRIVPTLRRSALDIATIVACAVLVMTFVELWSLQAERYYKKLFNAYLVAMSLSTVDPPPASPIATSQVPQFATLADLPGLVATGEFRRAASGATDGYELSAATVVGGRVIVADNETGLLQERVGALFEVTGGSPADRLFVRRTRGGLPWKADWDDIEGLASSDTTLFAIASHGLDSDGYYDPTRHVLVRQRLDSGGRVLGQDFFRGLAPLLLKHLQGSLEGVLQPARAVTQNSSVVRPTIKDLNIEGLEIERGSGDLLLGLRSPVVRASDGDSAALILRVHSLDRLFSGGDTQVSVFQKVELGGRGIAALEYDSRSRGYLIAAAPFSENDPDGHSSLWLWRDGSEPKELMRFPGHKLEGIARITWEEENALLLAFDEEEWVPGETVALRRQFGRLVVIENDGFD